MVCDDEGGIRKAVERVWPDTRVQRCLFHVYMDIASRTTRRPNLQAGQGLLHLARRLTHAHDLEAATQWLSRYSSWRSQWNEFLEDTSTYRDGSQILTHQCPIKARNSLDWLIRAEKLFAFLDPNIPVRTPTSSTNNRIESHNALLRELLRNHRGLSLVRRVKAIHWHCSRHTQSPPPLNHVLGTYPTDRNIQDLYRRAWENQPHQQWASTGIPERYGTGINWTEFHA